MKTTTNQNWQVWLGCYASIWAHRGYEVSGETVYTDSRADAMRLVSESLGGSYVAVRGDDGTYCYRTQADADSDDSGTQAVAVVSRVEVES